MADQVIESKNTDGEPKKRISKGKRPIKIEKIESKNTRQVTFSKRRTGLFSMIEELCTLTGAEIAAITFSEAGKVRSFGLPSEDAVIQRYLTSPDPNFGDSSNHNHNHYCTDASTWSTGGFWWDEPVDNLELAELERFKAALEGLRDDVVTTIDDISSRSMSITGFHQDYFGFGYTDEGLGAQVSDDFVCIQNPRNPTPDVPLESLPADVYLDTMSTRGFI